MALIKAAKRLKACRNCPRPTRSGRVICQFCHDKQMTAQRKRYRTRRSFLVDHFGPNCQCCGESEFQFLTLDHVNNDGAAHRRILRNENKGGRQLIDDIYRKIHADLPHPDIQVLCANCNLGRARNKGICPHHAINPKSR